MGHNTHCTSAIGSIPPIAASFNRGRARYCPLERSNSMILPEWFIDCIEVYNPTQVLMNRSVLLLILAFVGTHFSSAELMPARHKQGSTHGFLLVKSLQGKVIGVGDLLEVVQHSQVHSRLVFRFRDGSVDDDSTVFSEEDVLHLISDHHVQRGPSFPVQLDLNINAAAHEAVWKETKAGKVEVYRKRMELPRDLANGIIPLVIENIPPDAVETKVSYLASDLQPRIVTLSIKREARDRFTVGGIAGFANRYLIHVELGGLTGIIAPLIGKQPADSRAWIIPGEVPIFAKVEGAFYQGGPVWTVELASPVWSGD